MEVYFDLEGEPDLAALHALPEYPELKAAMERLKAAKVANATVAFRLADRGTFPEGVAWDSKSGDFFVSAQPGRKIVRVTPKGTAKDFIPTAEGGIGMVFGLRVDGPRRLLWAVSSAEPVMKGYSEALAGQSGLFAFDLGTGKLRHRIWLPKGAEGQNLDDLTVAADGRVYATQPERGAIYTVAPGGERLEAVVPPGGISYPNGIDVTPDGKRLYVSDYSTGIFAVDPATGAVVPLKHAPNVATNGIDGLAYADGALYAVQNGINPNRVLRLDLGPDGLEITRVTTLERNTPEMEEPTLGVVVKERFCFVANSHDGKLRAKGGPPRAETLSPPAVLCVPR
jgi:sugar lactone lactonase YvrE